MRKSTYSRSTWIWCADQFCRTFWKILFCWLTAWFVTCCMDICLFKSSFLIVWLFAQWCHVSFLHMANVITASSLLSLQVNVQLCRVRFAAGDARDPPPQPPLVYMSLPLLNTFSCTVAIKLYSTLRFLLLHLETIYSTNVSFDFQRSWCHYGGDDGA